MAALYITHDLAVVAQVSDDIMVLRNGKTVELGDPGQIIHAPREDYTRALVSVRRIAHAEKPPTAQPLLEVRNVTASYSGREVKALDQMSVQLSRGQTLAVVGESGSGKSTLARVITGLLPPLQGDIVFDGKVLPARLPDRSKEQLRGL